MGVGFSGLFSIVVIVLSILFVWSLLSEVKWDKLLVHPHSPKSRMLRIVIAVIIGYWLGSFILQYWGFSTMLQDFVE